MEVIYRVINKTTNEVIDAHVWNMDDKIRLPSQYDPDEYHYLKGEGGSNVGHTYCDGEFIAPPPQILPVVPILSTTESPDKAVIANLQKDIKTLSAGLLQVIEAFNKMNQ
jgi:hypothetical protein